MLYLAYTVYRRHWSSVQPSAEHYQHLPTVTVCPTQRPSAQVMK